MELCGDNKQFHLVSASDARGQKILENTTYHDGCRHQVGMLWNDNRDSLPDNDFSAPVQLKSLERRLDIISELKISYLQTIRSELDKGSLLKSTKNIVFKLTALVSGTYSITLFSTLTNPAKTDVCSLEQQSSMVLPFDRAWLATKHNQCPHFLPRVPVGHFCLYWMHVSASWRFSTRATVTSFFVARWPSWRNCCEPIHASQACVTKLCAQTKRKRQNHVAWSSS